MAIPNPRSLNVSQAPVRFRMGMLLILSAVILGVFVGRTLLAQSTGAPRLFAIFNLITLLASIGTVGLNVRAIRLADWLLALVVGIALGATWPLTHFYPVLELPDRATTAVAHGGAVAVVFLAGLVILRQGGPVRLQLAVHDWKKLLIGLGLGMLVGLPFAIFNAFAFSLMQGQPMTWQNPLLAAVGAFQPGVVEEIFYRFTFLGIIWLLLRPSFPGRAVLIAGIFSLVVHNYAHLDDLFVNNPIFALAYGGVIAIIFGLPMLVLAVRRDLESAIGFHWMQDFIRFAAGF